MIADDSCLVWWARPVDYRDSVTGLLSGTEVERSTRMRRAEDRVRQRLGAALLRLAVSAVTHTAPADVTVTRTCPRCAEPHGRPELPGTGLYASITHSGEFVGLALTGVAPVGLDVERIAEVDVDGLSRTVLHATERAPDLTDFFTYWTRKEAVVKATGDGLLVPLSEVRVTGPAEPAALIAYPGRAHQPARLVDLHPKDGYRAALAVLVDRAVTVDERPGSELLAGVTP